MSKLLITAGWGHVPHLDEETKTRLLESYPAYEHKARTEGEPLLGSGLVFPVEESTIVCEPFPIPKHWVQINGLDFGWDHPTAAVNLAWDRDADVVYVCKDYAAKETVPVIHAAAIKAWGAWIPVAWPHDGLQHDKGSGEELASLYRKHGLNMLLERATHPPQPGDLEGSGDNGVEAGIQEMLERMKTQQWKVFSTCTQWLEERRTYHRANGKIIKNLDDVISASRYGYMMLRHARVQTVVRKLSWQDKLRKGARTAMSS
jgi:hypothetical protein